MGGGAPVAPDAASDVERLVARVKELEKAVASSSNQDAMVAAVQAQTKAVQEAIKANARPKHSTIKVTPQIKWPVLGDESGNDKCDVKEFFETFHQNCSFANDGAGMLPSEMLTVLKSCLRGAKEKIYNNQRKGLLATGEWHTNPEGCFQVIQARLMRFMETPLEKQTRLQQQLPVPDLL